MLDECALNNLSPIDQAGVVASQSSKDNWVFNPTWTPEYLGHPLAGHRQFGLADNGNSTFTFYLTGASLSEQGSVSGLTCAFRLIGIGLLV